MEEFKQRVGERIAAARDAKGWTQSELARALPSTVDTGSISRWETGKVFPEQHLDALAAALDVDPSYLLVPEPEAGPTPDLMDALAPDRLARLEQKVDALTTTVELLARLHADDEPGTAEKPRREDDPPHT